MSTKVKKAAPAKTAAPTATKRKAAPAKAVETKKAAPAAPKAAKAAAPAKTTVKSATSKAPAKKSIEVDIKESLLQATAVEGDDMEDAEDMEGASSSGGGTSSAAALAAAASGQESASFKNFRHHPDMENFYRFIYENDLRVEALQIIDEMMIEKMAKRQQAAAAKPAGKQASR